MGNGTSAGGDGSRYGGIYIKLDQEVLIPGQPVQGTIYLNLTTQYPGDKICLEIKGQELAKWTERQRKTRHRKGKAEHYYVTVKRSANRFVIMQEIDVYDWRQGAIVPAGQYSFPFQFVVPDHLPGSFFLRRGNAVAEIKYSVEAFLKPEQESVPKLKHKVGVTVREMPKAPIETREISQNIPIKTCCCCEKGVVSMKTAFEKNAYAPCEEARILSEIDNSKCSVGISNVKFSLVQTIRLSTGVHHKTFGYTVATTDLGRVEAGQIRAGNTRLEASIRLPPGQEGKAKEFMNDESEDYNPDPTSMITPTTNGRYVISNFHLSLVSEIDGCMCCENNPANQLPVTIYSAALQRAPEPIAPPNWRPQQMPVANLVIIIDPGMMSPYPMQQDPNMMMPQNYNQPNQQIPQSINTSYQQQDGQYDNGYQHLTQDNNMSFQQPQYNAQTYGIAQPNYIQAQPVQVGQNMNQYPIQGQY